MEVYPSLAFDSLFDNQGSRRTLSILDRVKDQAATLQRRVSHTDRAKLDEYLTSVREVEKRVERTRTAKDRAEERARDRGRPAFAMRRPDNGLPEDIREHMRLMCDIIALAFQTDKTRVATLLLCRDLSGLFYPFLDVRTAHHPTSHEDHSDAYERVTRYYVGQLAYLAGRLAKMPEGQSTVLDNSCLMFISERACCQVERLPGESYPALYRGRGAFFAGMVLLRWDSPQNAQNRVRRAAIVPADRRAIPVPRTAARRWGLAVHTGRRLDMRSAAWSKRSLRVHSFGTRGGTTTSADSRMKVSRAEVVCGWDDIRWR
jgi:hypothetical protein